jgi:hypothetical protein
MAAGKRLVFSTTLTLEDMGTEGANPEQASPGESLR